MCVGRRQSGAHGHTLCLTQLRSLSLLTLFSFACQRGHDGYLIDFGDIKKVTRALCKELNEHLIVPTRSDVLKIDVREREVRVVVRV